MTATEPVTLDALLGRLRNVRGVGPGRWRASCPVAGHAHGDASPSLDVKRGDRVAAPLTSCRSRGHSYSEVLAALNFDRGARDPLPATARRPSAMDALVRWCAKHPPHDGSFPPPGLITAAALTEAPRGEKWRRPGVVASYKRADMVRRAHRLLDAGRAFAGTLTGEDLWVVDSAVSALERAILALDP